MVSQNGTNPIQQNMIERVFDHVYPLFGVFIPFLCFLIIFSYIVFSIGEFKEKSNFIPKVLMILLVKFAVLGMIFYNIMIFQVLNWRPIGASVTQTFDQFLLTLFGMLVTFETIISVTQLNRINKANRFISSKIEKLPTTIRRYLAKSVLSIYHSNKFILSFNFILIITITISGLVGLVINSRGLYIQQYVMFIVYVIVKINFIKSLKNDIKKSNT